MKILRLTPQDDKLPVARASMNAKPDPAVSAFIRIIAVPKKARTAAMPVGILGNRSDQLDQFTTNPHQLTPPTAQRA
jgi:hypothetical protein